MAERRSGILLHITSLPSRFGVGDLGPDAATFAETLAECGQSLWQILPIRPTSEIAGNSPYSSPSAFAGNPLLLSPDKLVEDGYVDPAWLHKVPNFPTDRVNFKSVIPWKKQLLRQAFESHFSLAQAHGFDQFCREQAGWLESHALFLALKTHFKGLPWWEWPAGVRDRSEGELWPLQHDLDGGVREEKFRQFLFFRQWDQLKSTCLERGVRLVGDLPIYVSLDSSDVWANRGLFQLNPDGSPKAVAGVPPDYFSKTGQRWGNPLYDWEALAQSGFAWWIDRFRHEFKLFDLIRLDHFRGFAAFWEIPAEAATAVDGKWVAAPGKELFEAAAAQLGKLPFIAEDLGLITDDVHELRNSQGFPGMKVLQFALSGVGGGHPFLPHNFAPNCVVYTGTHDNAPTKAWFMKAATRQERARLSTYLGRTPTEESVSWDLIQLAMTSRADTAIFPLQDILSLGLEARMNVPSKSSGNWEWRFLSKQLTKSLKKRLKELTDISGRMTT